MPDLDIINPESVRQGLIDLYRRYCNEWDAFPVVGERTDLGAVN